MALLVGLTGGMGSGKSLAAAYFRERGARVIDADLITRQLVEPGKPAWEEIVGQFGRDILNPDQTLDRERMGRIVFKDERLRHKLEGILHPRVFIEERRLYEEFIKEDPGALVVIDAALLIESGNYKNVDEVVVVQCPRDLQVQRVMQRNAASRDEVENRLKTQMPLEKKAEFADYILMNDGNPDTLKSQVAELYDKLKEKI